MSCLGCKKRDNEIEDAAKSLANETGKWVGIFRTESGERDYAVVDAGQYPWEQFFTPDDTNNDVRAVPTDTA